jgi:hypothetical protein
MADVTGFENSVASRDDTVFAVGHQCRVQAFPVAIRGQGYTHFKAIESCKSGHGVARATPLNWNRFEGCVVPAS